MLDIKAIRDDPEPFRKGLARRNLADAVDALLAADERRRTLISQVEALRTEQNAASKAIGGAQGDEKQQLIEAVGKVSAELKMVEPELEAAETAPLPAGLTACTLKVYAVPWVRLLIVALVTGGVPVTVVGVWAVDPMYGVTM